MILSLEQTADVKPVKEELVQEVEEEEEAEAEGSPADVSEPLLKQEEKSPEVEAMELLPEEADGQPLSSLYDHLKRRPGALTMLAPAAGDTVVPLDFSCPGLCPFTPPQLGSLVCELLLTPALLFARFGAAAAEGGPPLQRRDAPLHQ